MAADPPFSLGAYRATIQAGLESGYRFLTFGALAAGVPDSGRQCLLRHDVDVSVEYALAMARVEAEAGVAATYFLMLRSPAYNLLGRHASLAVREMVALGHDIGVHFDAEHPLVRLESLDAQVRQEAAMIGELAGTKVSAFSFHQPTPEILERRVAVPGLINTYNKDQLAGWHYVSDSNRSWKEKSGLQLLSDAVHPKIQLLVHPMWWVCEAEATDQVWDEAIRSNFELMQRQFLDTERAYGARREMALSRKADPISD
jgi:hypothetical protein